MMISSSPNFFLKSNEEANINLVLNTYNVILCGTIYKKCQQAPFYKIIVCNHQNIYITSCNKKGNYFLNIPKDKYNILVYDKNSYSCIKINLQELINIQNFFL